MQHWANRLTFCYHSVPAEQAAPWSWKTSRSFAELSSKMSVSADAFWFPLNQRDWGTDPGGRAPHFHLIKIWNNMQTPQLHSLSLSLSHPSHYSCLTRLVEGGGRMWHQLVISSDKETCWMCFCIKKNLIPCFADFSSSQCSRPCLCFKIFKVFPFLPKQKAQQHENMHTNHFWSV